MTTKKQSEPTTKLSKIQKFYIAKHRQRDPKQLAVDIESTIGQVRSYLKTLDRSDAKKAAADAAAEKVAAGNPNTGVTQIRVDDLMGKHHRGGVVVMTPAASEMGDEFGKQHRAMPKRLQQNVQEIRPKRN